MTRRFLLPLLFVLILAAPLAAEDWQTLPIWGADVRSLAIHPEEPDVVLAGTSAGQLYRSDNGGRTWKDAGAHLPFPGWVVSALRFDPNQPSRLWVALWGVWGSGHVAFSDNLGKTWVARAAGLPDEPVYVLSLVPGREGRIYAGTRSGVWGSEDGGGSWRRLTAALPEAQKVTSLFVDPAQPETVIAGTWRRAYRSDDGGATWAGIFEGMVLDSEVFSLTPIAGRPGEIWATTCGWVYQTKNRGGKWERFKEGFQERRTVSFAALPGGRLLAGTVAGLHVSDDGGKTWRRVGDPALAILAIANHPAHPERVILGTEGSGVWISDDGASNLRPANEGMLNTRISALSAMGDDLLVAVGHAGPISGVHVSRDRGRTFSGEFRPLPGVLDFAAHEGRLYAATEKGLYERRGVDWHRLKELGDSRVEQLVESGQHLVARTGSGLWELRGPLFVQHPYKHGPPRSAAVWGDALWVSDAQAVYRLTEKANDTIPAPFAGGRLQRLDDQLLLWGSAGTWTRTGPEGSWVELTKDPSRVVSTGDSRFAALLISGETVRLFDREARKFQAIDVPVPARDIVSALVLDGKLLLGTSGYGVIYKPTPHP